MNHKKIGDVYLQKYPNRMYARDDFYGYENGTWSPMPNIRAEFWEVAAAMEKTSPTSSIVTSVVDYVKGIVYKQDTDVDRHGRMINMQNGVLDLDTGNVYAHSPDYLFTSQLGFAYDSNSDCPRWKEFIDQVLVSDTGEPDSQMGAFIQEAFGYSLTASVEHETSFWLIGSGANGKSTMLRVLNALGGSSVLHLNLGLLDQDKYQLAQMGGKRIVICSEAPDTTVADSTLKAIISGDAMNVRSIYGRPFVIKPCAKVWWAMNNPPRVMDTSEGFWRKMRAIPFNRSFAVEERDRQLIGKLLEELPGIFNWALAGLKRLELEGFFTECDQIDDATDQYRDESDTSKQFVEECCARSANGSTSASELYQAYYVWAKDNGHKPMTSQRAGREWRRIGLKGRRDAKKRYWDGVELLSSDTVDDLLSRSDRSP